MVDIPVPATADVDDVLRAVTDAANVVATDTRYAPSCLAAPRQWGVVAADAATMTVRVSVRTTTAERERITRAIRREALRGLHALDVFVPAPPGPPA